MATGIPDLLDRLTQADLIGVVRELIGEVGRLRAENEKLSGAFYFGILDAEGTTTCANFFLTACRPI